MGKLAMTLLTPCVVGKKWVVIISKTLTMKAILRTLIALKRFNFHKGTTNTLLEHKIKKKNNKHLLGIINHSDSPLSLSLKKRKNPRTTLIVHKLWITSFETSIQLKKQLQKSMIRKITRVKVKWMKSMRIHQIIKLKIWEQAKIKKASKLRIGMKVCWIVKILTNKAKMTLPMTKEIDFNFFLNNKKK